MDPLFPRALAAATLLLILSFTPTASAPGAGWGTPVIIDDNSPGDAGDPQVAADPLGNAMAVWDQFNGTRLDVWANRYDAVTGWGTPGLLETNDSGDAYAAQISMSASGYAVAAWNQFDGLWTNIWANVYSPGTGWGTATLLETDNSNDAWEPQVAMDPSGNAIAVWYHWGTPISSVWSNYYEAGVGWSPPSLVEFDDTGDAFEPQVGMDASGNALAIWVYFDGVGYSLASNTFVPGTGWGTPVSVESDSTGDVVTPHVAVNPAGNAVAVWTWDNRLWYDVWGNSYDPGTGWGTETLLEADDQGDAFDAEVAIDPSGNAVAVWSQSTDTLMYNVFANRFVPGSGWGSPALLETDDTWDALYPQVALDASGVATVVWFQYVSLTEDIYANRYAPGAGWEGAVFVEDDDAGDAWSPQVAADPAGNVTVVWYQSDGVDTQIFANRHPAPSGPGTSPPAAPDGVGATLPGGGQDVLVSWQPSADESDPAAFDHYEVLRGEAYDAAGVGYGVVAPDLPAGTTSFTDTATLPGTTHFYVVRAVGPGGASIAVSQGSKYVQTLPSGRSLLGLSVDVQDYAVTSVLVSVLPVLDFVSAYDPSDGTDPMKSWIAAKPVKELTSLGPDLGFWVTLQTAAEWRIAGGVPATNAVSLVPGWNLVPYPGAVSSPASVTLSGLPVERLEGFDANGGPYYLQVLAGDAVLRPGEGYWIYASSPAIWIVSN